MSPRRAASQPDDGYSRCRRRLVKIDNDEPGERAKDAGQSDQGPDEARRAGKRRKVVEESEEEEEVVTPGRKLRNRRQRKDDDDEDPDWEE